MQTPNLPDAQKLAALEKRCAELEVSRNLFLKVVQWTYSEHCCFSEAFKSLREDAMDSNSATALASLLKPTMEDIAELQLMEHTESPCDESGSHYSDNCPFCKKVEAILARLQSLCNPTQQKGRE